MTRKGKGVKRIIKEERRFREKKKKGSRFWLSEETIKEEMEDQKKD